MSKYKQELGDLIHYRVNMIADRDKVERYLTSLYPNYRDKDFVRILQDGAEIYNIVNYIKGQVTINDLMNMPNEKANAIILEVRAGSWYDRWTDKPGTKGVPIISDEDYSQMEWNLVDARTGTFIELGDTVSSGDKRGILVAVHPPHKPGSTGKVTVRSRGTENTWYAGVIEAKFVRVD